MIPESGEVRKNMRVGLPLFYLISTKFEMHVYFTQVSPTVATEMLFSKLTHTKNTNTTTEEKKR